MQRNILRQAVRSGQRDRGGGVAVRAVPPGDGAALHALRVDRGGGSAPPEAHVFRRPHSS